MKGFSAEVERLSELSEDLRVKKQKLEKGLCSLKKQKQSTEEDMDAKLQEKTKEGKTSRFRDFFPLEVCEVLF